MLSPGLLLTGALLLLLGGLSARAEETLRQAFEKDFLIGAAVSTQIPGGEDQAIQAMLASQFNQVTPENCMKFGPIHPEPGRYQFDPADRLVAFAEAHRMVVIGHALVWHQQTPNWVFTNAAGKSVTRDELIARMREHMTALLGRYRGRIRGWDVVNEAFNSNGSMRQTPWHTIIGDDLIEVAFKTAHEIDPAIELYYNDFGMTSKGKREATVKLIRSLKAKGLRIDGVGMQGHWGLTHPSLAAIEESILAFAAEGVKVQVTELDIDVLPGSVPGHGGDLTSKAYQEKIDPYREGLPEAMQTKLAERYTELFRLFLKHRDKIARITFWGASDRYSWKNNFPVKGRVNHALLFDREAKPKPAFHAVLSLKETAQRPAAHNTGR